MLTPARIGVVLAGGRATRMGGDKAGAVLAGQTLLERAVATVAAAGLHARVCARTETELPQVDGLEPDAIWREPDGPGPHPLAGIAHALRQAGEPIVVMPVDLPLLPASMLSSLASHHGSLAVLGVGGRPAALVLLVDPSFADRLAAAAAAGAPALRTVLALGAALVEVGELVGPDAAERALTNVNTVADLDRVGGQLGHR